MEIVVELYICEKCSHVELELNGECPECGGKMNCVDFVPRESAQQSTKSKLTCPSCKSENVFEAVICVNCGAHSAPPTGVCTCGAKPEEHPSKGILTMHHYSFMHYGRVTGCAICEMEAQ